VIEFVSDLQQVGGFSGYSGFLSTNKTDRHDITEILLKVALNILPLKNVFMHSIMFVVSKKTLIFIFNMRVGISFSDLTLPHICACPILRHTFSSTSMLSFQRFAREVVCFVIHYWLTFYYFQLINDHVINR
jgi:hypothetical protein